MSLQVATLLFAALCLGVGLYGLLWLRPGVLLSQLRHPALRVIMLAVAMAWFFGHLSELGDADFGQYKRWMMVFFGLVAILSYIHLPDGLSIRALAVIGLLLANALLDAAYMQPTTLRLVLVWGVYALVVTCLVLAALPHWAYRLLALWEQQPGLQKAFAWGCCSYSLALMGVAACYPPLVFA